MLLAKQNTKLVVLDSVAAVFRLESTASVKVVNTDWPQRLKITYRVVQCGSGSGRTLSYYVSHGQLHAHLK